MAKTTTPKMKATKTKAKPIDDLETKLIDLIRKYDMHETSLRGHEFNIDLLAADLKRIVRRLDQIEKDTVKKGFLNRILGK